MILYIEYYQEFDLEKFETLVKNTFSDLTIEKMDGKGHWDIVEDEWVETQKRNVAILGEISEKDELIVQQFFNDCLT
jgi:hypothetical protein